MQLAVIEFARSLLGWQDANSSEFNPSTAHPVVINPSNNELVFVRVCTATWLAMMHDFLHLTYRVDQTELFKSEQAVLACLQCCLAVLPTLGWVLNR